MSKEVYIGVNSTARKIKAIFIGVNGVARKVVAGFIGVANVARQFFALSGVYYNSAKYLNSSRYSLRHFSLSLLIFIKAFSRLSLKNR